jgi:hypothetical protein
MSSHRSYLNAVLRDPDTTSVMAAPGPPGPLMTDKHDGTVNDVGLGIPSESHPNPDRRADPAETF